MTEDDHTLAPCDTTLGKLQRGRGAGWLEASGANRAVAHAMLVQCLTHDPRLDGQLEEHATYYATLAVAVDLPAELLAPALFDERPNTDVDKRSDQIYLMIETLFEIARRGRGDAAALLRLYAQQGIDWTSAVHYLIEMGDAMEGVGEAIAARFPAPEALDEAIGSNVWDGEAGTWRRLHPSIAASVDRLGLVEQERRRPSPVAAPPADLSTAELLQRDKGYLVLRHRHSAQDQHLLVQAICSGGDVEFHNAVYSLILSRKLDASFFPSLIEAIRHGPTHRHGRIRRAIGRSAGASVLPLARRWAADDNDDVAYTGGLLLFEHGDASDLPWIREQARRTPEPKNIYPLCGAAEALGRLRDRASIGTLETIYEAAPYDRLRQYAAESLNTIDPMRFAQTYATECLWDCCYETCGVGCTTALMSPQVHARLVQLANDPLEDKTVREAAASRIGVEA